MFRLVWKVRVCSITCNFADICGSFEYTPICLISKFYSSHRVQLVSAIGLVVSLDVLCSVAKHIISSQSYVFCTPSANVLRC